MPGPHLGGPSGRVLTSAASSTEDSIPVFKSSASAKLVFSEPCSPHSAGGDCQGWGTGPDSPPDPTRVPSAAVQTRGLLLTCGARGLPPAGAARAQTALCGGASTCHWDARALTQPCWERSPETLSAKTGRKHSAELAGAWLAAQCLGKSC